MLNRKQLSNGNMQFQDFATAYSQTKVGAFVEVPMTASGWTVGRFEIISVTQDGGMLTAEAKRVA